MKNKKVIICFFACVTLFFLGFFVMKLFVPARASSENKSYSKIEAEKVLDKGELFSEDYYKYSISDEDKRIICIERIKQVNTIPENQLYSAQDIEMIMQKLLGTSGEVHEQKVDDQVSVFDEFENGFPTGKSASVVYDSGFISYIVLRDGKLNGTNDVTEFVDKKEAYDKSLQAIKEKYADKNLQLKENYNEKDISTFYDPHRECLCYTFEVQGAIDGKWDDELSVFVFTPMVNVNDITDIEIASTFCY
ncbi:hypothetical protein SAMN04487934_1284 [Eubacterium ruminantium]|nr:hypothetical protein SAMN04487934_1284 [Eubacterium ruminantium]